jgi:hypothetical protein
MRRLSSGMLVPLLLALAGVALIIVGQLNLDQPPGPSLPPIPEPTSPVAVASPSASPASTVPGTASPEPTPSPTPIPEDWVATQLQIESVGINVLVEKGAPPNCGFPLHEGAYINCDGSEPGRGTNAYITAHAELYLFKPLWNVQLGAEVKVLMSDGTVLRYVVTEIHPNVACADNTAPVPAKLPLALKYAPPYPACPGAIWQASTDHERLTLQTSQGFNRNYGELIVVAEPMP